MPVSIARARLGHRKSAVPLSRNLNVPLLVSSSQVGSPSRAKGVELTRPSQSIRPAAVTVTVISTVTRLRVDRGDSSCQCCHVQSRRASGTLADGPGPEKQACRGLAGGEIIIDTAMRQTWIFQVPGSPAANPSHNYRRRRTCRLAARAGPSSAVTARSKI